MSTNYTDFRRTANEYNQNVRLNKIIYDGRFEVIMSFFVFTMPLSLPCYTTNLPYSNLIFTILFSELYVASYGSLG